MSALHYAFNLLCRRARKINRARRFNRAKAARRCTQLVKGYWAEGIDALFAYMGLHNGWRALQNHIRQRQAADSFGKAIDDRDRAFLAELLARFGYLDPESLSRQAESIVRATAVPTFEEAGRFALRQLGVVDANFDLRNEAILTRLLERKDATIFATRNTIEDALATISRRFGELGQSAYSDEVLRELRATLGYKTEWEARRFSLTETGIAAELAQAETYRRNGVRAKQWNILDVNTRPTHAELAEAILAIDDKFNVGGHPADHPLDPRLPPEELVNCHCWLSPVIDDEYEVDGLNVWEGK